MAAREAPAASAPLDDEPFSFRETRDGRVFLAWRGGTVTILRGRDARRFVERLQGLNAAEAQLLMARVTGNFKRGNERLASSVDKSRPDPSAGG